MTSREIIAALLKKEIPERMGLHESFWPETLNEYWPRQGYPKDEEPAVYFNYDILNCSWWPSAGFFPGRNEVIEETEDWQVTRDGWGAILKNWRNKSGAPEHIGYDVTTQAQWREYRDIPLQTNIERLGDFQKQRDDLADAKRRGKFSVFSNAFLFELLRAAFGHETVLPAMLLEPEWIHDFCSVYVDFYRRHYDILFREVGLPDGMFIYEDWGYNKGLLCSPAAMRELILPHNKALVSFFKDYGLPVIVHSCGNVMEAVPLFIEMGIDCLQPMEAKAGCDVIQLAQVYGSTLAYMGNINVVTLSTNDPAKVEAEIVPKLAKLKEMRIPYVFHSDHSITPDVSLSTYQYALKLLRENWTY